MNDERRIDFEATYFRYCRDALGNLVALDVARQNGRLVPRFPREITEPYYFPADAEAPDYLELVEEICQNLNGTERRRFLLATRDDQSISAIAAMEGVSRQAVIDCLHRAAKKSQYVEIWLRRKKKRNQHE